MSEIFRVALPLILVRLSLAILPIIESALTGRLDRPSLEALALGGLLVNLIAVGATNITAGVGPQIARAISKRRQLHLLRQGVYASIMIGVAAAAIIALMSNAILLGGIAALPVVNLTRGYILAAAPSVIALCVFDALRFALSAQGNLKMVVLASAAAIVLQLIGAALLLPRFGLAGLGAANTITYGLLAVVVSGLVRAKLLSNRPSGHVIRAIFEDGWAIGGTAIVEMGLWTISGLIATSMGQGGPHRIAGEVTYFTFTVSSAIAQAVSFSVSRGLGHGGGQNAVLQSSREAMKLSLGCTLAVALLLWNKPEIFVGIFLGHAATDTALQTALLLKIAAWVVVVDGVQIVLTGILRGFRDNGASFGLVTFAHWVVGLPTAYALSRFQGVFGVWVGLAISLSVATLLLGLRVSYKINALR